MTPEQAKHMQSQFRDKMVELGLLSHEAGANANSVNCGNLSWTWRVDHPRGNGAQDAYGLRVELRGFGRRGTSYVCTNLTSLVNKIVDRVKEQDARLIQEDETELENGQAQFNLGWCAFRHGFQLKNPDDIKIKVGNQYYGQVRYDAELDTISVPARISSAQYFIDVRHLRVLFEQKLLKS